MVEEVELVKAYAFVVQASEEAEETHKLEA